MIYSLKSASEEARNALLLLQPRCHIGCKVSNDHIGTGAADAGQYLHGDAAFIDPAVAGGGFDHGVFATDVVGGDGQVTMITHLANDVHVGHGGLDHDDIGPFGDIEVYFAQSFANVGRVHLVSTTIAKLGC